ncbi:receptor-like protein EIX2 [Camellia sinensis]|uniref:receptor-like protein EIX2 n=1 Tax=Camellia sinensis TaxID=4442 RepID=UPI001036ADCF|nr:receptor-like protein EIX2 [Camellia sinensis]
MGSLDQIQTLHLCNNNFSGKIPSSLKRCTNLIMIDLGGNKLTGKIPAWIGAHLTSLIVLSLRFNEFKGSIPRHICHLNQIQILDFSHNRLSGNIPHCFHNFTAMVESKSSSATISFDYSTFYGPDTAINSYIEDALLSWKGQESEYINIFRLVKSIDLSGNNLVGKIPKQVGSLVGLVSLNLSRNNLTINIIQEVGQMKMLESLDLSANELSGAIPTGLSDLNFLGVLNLSNNRLSRKIPISTQLQSFDPSAYLGNCELCGLPLPKKCPGEKIVVEPPVLVHGKDKRIQEDDDKFITTGFYVSVGLGFTFGFWTIFGTMIFNKPSRHAYFKFLDCIKNWVYVRTALSMTRLGRRLQR